MTINLKTHLTYAQVINFLAPEIIIMEANIQKVYLIMRK